MSWAMSAFGPEADIPVGASDVRFRRRRADMRRSPCNVVFDYEQRTQQRLMRRIRSG
jgi:hypothetical protein